MYCPDCGQDPCVCKQEHPNSYYSDPPGEHEFHDGFDYSDSSSKELEAIKAWEKRFKEEDRQMDLFPEFAQAI